MANLRFVVREAKEISAKKLKKNLKILTELSKSTNFSGENLGKPRRSTTTCSPSKSLYSHLSSSGVLRDINPKSYCQGLDPMAISEAFSVAQYMGEKEIMGIDCFVLKLCADQNDLADRCDNTAETIKHVTFGYFSQKSGLLVYLEDSYLTRIQSPGTCPQYWETTMGSKIEDYRTLEGVMIAHSGQTHAIITRFGDNFKLGPTILRMEEAWVIDDVAFNVQGLSMDCFIPPPEVKSNCLEENLKYGCYSPLDR
ncbi:uncharacterized protein LOC141627708 [Silene latifolia]|uniref:uncharacterized protein LOC141627708 n=1 Tax=Silene latifolia TaxID=37657 RepID=UPI003D787502